MYRGSGRAHAIVFLGFFCLFVLFYIEHLAFSRHSCWELCARHMLKYAYE